MRRSRFSLVLGAILLLAGGDAVAQDSDDPVPAGECCLQVHIPIGARTVSMGQALTIRAGREAAFMNPASLTDISDDGLAIHRSTMVPEVQLTTFSLFIHSQVAGVFAFTYRFIDFGESELTDDFGNVIGRASEIDQLLIASYATRISHGLSGGMSFKFYDFRDRCTGSCGGESFAGNTYMFDAGLQWQASSDFLVIGASVMNVGPPLQIKNAAQSDPTPVRLRVGAAYEVGHRLQKDSTIAVWVQGGVVQPVRDTGTPSINLGVEISLNETVFLRAGHASDPDGVTGGAGIGVGLRYQRYDLGVAKKFASSLLETGDPVHISFGVTF